jgi:flagellar biosynthesis/type III secretory pathway protein FliH
MCDVTSFPATVDEFMEQHKIVDREEVYTNGAEMVPIFRMKQWFEHEVLGKDINVPGKSALDHIHNVVAEREYQRGYKQAKEEYDHKLTEIKSRFKDRYYNKGYSEGYEQGKADAEKEMHDNILRYRMPEPWEGE